MNGTVFFALMAGTMLPLQAWPKGSDGVDLPAWSWAGGLCGALALTAMTATAPRLGAAAMISMVITGQAMFSLVIDQYGLFDSPPSPITARRVIALCLLIAGAVLFSKRNSP
jgi:transporter family-2 protein